MSERSPLAGFDDATFSAVTSATSVERERLEDVARTHQENVRDLPGVDDIVYEWRNHFHRDPLVIRTEEAYVLALPDHVWDEFAEGIDTTAAELDSLRQLHHRQATAIAPDSDRFDDESAVVLTRP